jgi:hypothetical protein
MSTITGLLDMAYLQTGRLFACPADVFHYDGETGGPERVATAIHLGASYNFSSYVLNAGNIRDDSPFTNSFPGIAGKWFKAGCLDTSVPTEPCSLPAIACADEPNKVFYLLGAETGVHRTNESA